MRTGTYFFQNKINLFHFYLFSFFLPFFLFSIMSRFSSVFISFNFQFMCRHCFTMCTSSTQDPVLRKTDPIKGVNIWTTLPTPHTQHPKLESGHHYLLVFDLEKFLVWSNSFVPVENVKLEQQLLKQKSRNHDSQMKERDQVSVLFTSL